MTSTTTNVSVQDQKDAGVRRGELFRARRETLTVSVEALAARLECTPEDILAFEAGTLRPAGLDIYSLCAALFLPTSALTGDQERTAAVALVPVAEAWSGSAPLRDALAAARTILEVDEFLDRLAEPTASSPASLAGRGVPEAAQSAIPSCSLPVLPQRDLDPSGQGMDHTHARRVSLVLREMLSVDPWDVLDAQVLADGLGVPFGFAPLDESVRGVVTHTNSAPLVVLNSNHHSSVNMRSLAHLVMHVLMGDVTPALADLVPDEDDDSLFSCAGSTWQSCSHASLLASTTLDPVSALADEERRKTWGDCYEAGLDFIFSQPRVDLVEDERGPGKWETPENSTVFVPSLRKVLGTYSNDLLLPRGPGLTAWPRALVVRYLKVVSRGLMFPKDVADLGLTWVNADLADEACRAVGRHETVRRQLNDFYGGY